MCVAGILYASVQVRWLDVRACLAGLWHRPECAMFFSAAKVGL
jgi:hypothetical protein